MLYRDGRTRMDRRDFLKLGGTGLAGAVLLGTPGGLAWAQSEPLLDQEFGAAAEEYGVPKDLLLAMGYVNTLWEMPPPSASPYEEGDLHGRGAFGLMQLEQNPSRDTLGRAASLTELSETEIKTDRAANVRAGAALLADIQGANKPEDINGWREAVAGYAETDLYAQEVYETLKRGASATISTGESLKLAPNAQAEVPQIFTALVAADYGRARWYPAARGNYTNASRKGPAIDTIVVHVVQGSASGAVNWFANPDSDVSAHYTVGNRGGVRQSVRDEDIAYHAGHWTTNKRSIGIEHGGYVTNPRSFTDRMYRASAELSAYVARKYGVPINRDHIIGHNEVPGCPGPGGGGSCHTDPGRYWNWDRYIRLVKEYRRK